MKDVKTNAEMTDAILQSVIPTADIERQRDKVALIDPRKMAMRAGQVRAILNEILRLRHLLAATDGIPPLKP